MSQVDLASLIFFLLAAHATVQIWQQRREQESSQPTFENVDGHPRKKKNNIKRRKKKEQTRYCQCAYEELAAIVSYHANPSDSDWP